MASVAQDTIRTKIPARMDRLPWSRWHWLIVFSLGTVWILDGLEVTIKGAVGPALRETIGFSTVQVAGVASIYLLGAVSGALFWSYLTDRFGRKKLFIATLGVYMLGVLGTSTAGLFTDSLVFVWFAVFRFITGFGIGGEYAAINSAIDELIPARVRGWVDLAINGSWWIGTAAGAALGALYLNIFALETGWRIAFATGGLIAIGILLLRFFVPESPRWLITHGRPEEAEGVVRDIEDQVKDQTGQDELPEPPDDEAIELRERRSIGFIELGRTLFKIYPERSVVGFSLMATQAFLYNAIFFTYGLMLTTFFAVPPASVGWYLIPFAVGNYMGPLILGRWFDKSGRKTMIPLTFWVAGGLTVLAGLLFALGVYSQAWIMTLAWVVIFFFASAGASAGYLTVSETFPLEVRAMAIAFFYAIATAAGGIIGPILFGALITGDRWAIFWGYLIGGVLMAIGGTVHRFLGVEAAQRGLESVAQPLSVEEAEEDEGGFKPTGPAGFDPTDTESIKDFQREHGLADDGVIGPETMGAMRAAAGEDGGGDGIEEVTVVDVRDRDSVREFQEEYGLQPDGVIGPVTQGAIRAAERRVIVDPTDPEAIKRFQRAHGLREDGIIGPDTQAALRAVRAERAEQEAAASYIEVDVLDPESVKQFQRACALDDDAALGPQTRGALIVEQTRRRRNAGLDPTDPEQIRRFQEANGLEPDGVIGPRTQQKLLELAGEARPARREGGGGDGSDGEAGDRAPRRLLGVDPADPDSVIAFQAAHGLEPDGVIGPRTRHALRKRRHLLSGVDPTDEESVREFQREHGLTEDGVLGPETQGAIRALRERVEPAGAEEHQAVEEEFEDEDEEDGEEPEREILDFDPADPRQVREFQREHGLEDDGVIGPRTRAALRAVLLERRLALEGEEVPRPERRVRPLRPGRARAGGGFSISAYVPGEDREMERNIQDVLQALPRDGSMSSGDLREAVNARLWGPGRFRQVMDTAAEEGLVRKVGRDRWIRS